MMDVPAAARGARAIPHFTGEIAVTNLSLARDGGSRVLDSVSFNIPLDAHVAIIGQGGSGRMSLPCCSRA